MMSFRQSAFATLLTGLYVAVQPVQAQRVTSQFDPQPGSRIVLLGNTFADRMRHYGYLETLLQQRFPDRQLTVRNMGWSADEVGLQPRPLNFPGFGEKTTRLTADKPEINFQGFTHAAEGATMPIAFNVAGLNQDLYDQRADVLFLCFGLNEAFKGPAGLPQFEKDLGALIANLRANRYNGRSAPVLVLVSPIAHESLGGHFPDPTEHNANLALYTRSMQQTAGANGLYFVDLFTPSLAHMKNGSRPITINGIHLTNEGYQLAADWMGQALGWGRLPDPNAERSRQLRRVINLKDTHFFYRWRAVNGEYIYGRRREPFGVVAFPPELRKLNQMVAALDSVIWAMGKGPNTEAYRKALAIVDRRGQPVDSTLISKVPMVGRQGKAARSAAQHHGHGTGWPATTESFRLPKGYAINLFASEKDFPVEKPVAMSFDARGRLWVATMPTYPQYFPGIPVHDKLVILEDTDGDGKADKHTVFADDLYLPLGFEFGDGGVYVSQEPDLLFLKDTDGDDKADVREVVLTGFGSEDSHHATHAFSYGPDGALYFNEGTFLNSQIETPYGPVRSYAGTTYRFEPRTARLSPYISYPYYNPWGNVFDRWGTHLIGDASDGSNYFAPPMTGRIEYPAKHPRIEMFTETRVRPTAGIEIVSSRQFPDSVQGNFLVNNNIGFQGIKQHRIIEKGSGIGSKEVEPLLQSTDPNFRPIDLKFGPDGALYVVDWYKPLISHGENPPRDPARDTSHGRIWRITHTGNPTLPVIDLSKQAVPALLEHLNAHEDRLRYRVRARLRALPAAQVLPSLEAWLASLPSEGPDTERLRVEGLWLYQDFNVVNEALLKTLLRAQQPEVRAAATRVLLHWRDRVPESLALMRGAANDASPRVRLEAVAGLSYFDTAAAVDATLDALNYPTDYYLDYALRETLSALKPHWLTKLKGNPNAYSASVGAYLLRLCSTAELLAMPQTEAVGTVLLTRSDLDAPKRQEWLRYVAEARNTSQARVLQERLAELRQPETDKTLATLTQLLLTRPPAELKPLVPDALGQIRQDSGQFNRATAYALVIMAEGSDRSAWPLAQATATGRSDYQLGVSRLPDGALKTSLRSRSSALVGQPQSMGATTLEMKLSTVEAKMAFDKKSLTVPAGKSVTLLFENPDLMPHNVVIVKPGSAQRVGEAADAMAQLPNGFERNFVPNSPDVLVYTPLVNAGGHFRLTFKAPVQPGKYPFLCSFPGHWRVMQGLLNVVGQK